VEEFSPSKASSDRWMVTAGMAAAAGSAVVLALAPSIALGFVNRVAGSLQGFALLAGNWLGTLIGSQAMLS
jgi:hypothetical protein